MPKKTSSSVYEKRRQSVLKGLGGAPLLLRAAPEILRNGDVHYSYRQASSYQYLTGFEEPKAILLAIPNGKRHRTILFVRPKDPLMELWHGKRAGVAGALKHFGADEAIPIGEFWDCFKELSKDWDSIGYSLGEDASFDRQILAQFGTRFTGRPRRNQGLPTFVDPRPVIHALRQIKQKEEIECLDEACRITTKGHKVAMAICRPGMYEYELQAEFEAVFRNEGSPRNGYPSIVASGANACCLHYTANNRKIRKGDLVLLDAGAEFGHYSADVTRTFPASGKFSAAQRAVYQAVLKVQKKCIKAVKPGMQFMKVHALAQLETTKALLDLGLLKRGDVKKLVKKKAYMKYYMHGLGHWLGMDVHDCGAYTHRDGKPVELKPGMVLTVEPGIYIAANDKSVPKEFRGIGIRIEDDVLVTRGGNRVLTEAIPKEVRDVEALAQS